MPLGLQLCCNGLGRSVAVACLCCLHPHLALCMWAVFGCLGAEVCWQGENGFLLAPWPADVTSGINTRQKLKERDPALAALMLCVYGDGSWRYPATAPQQWPQWREQQQQQQQQQGAGKIATVGPSAAAEPQVQPGASRKRSRRQASGGSGGMHRLMAGSRRITRSLARLASSCLPSASMRS